MSMLYVLIPLALLLLVVAAWALLWAIRSGQFDDLDSQGWGVVLDEDRAVPEDTVGQRKDSQDSVSQGRQK